MNRLLHELEVHQIELEQQNEELRAAQDELEHARDEYHELYDQYRDLYDAAPIGYLTLSPKAEIIALNATACRILGGSHDGLIGAVLYKFLPRGQRDILFKHLQEVFAEPRTRTCEFTLQPSLPRQPIRVHLESIIGHEWTRDRVLVALSDITQQDELKRKLRDTERLVAIGAASATLTHEIGNPLNNILITVQTMGRQLSHASGERSAVRKNIHQIEQQIERLCNLVNEVRQLTMPPKLRTESVRVDNLIEEVVRMHRNTLNKRRIVVRQEEILNSCIPGDPVKLCHALANLLQNAIEATADDGEITLRVSDPGEWVCIEIANPGEPITPGLDVFEPFVTSKNDGIGLGLTIVKQIVSAHEGFVSHDSTADETKFRVMLPQEKKDHGTRNSPG